MINKFLSGVASSIGDQIVNAYWSFATSGLVLAALLGVACALRLAAVVPLIPIEYRAFMKPVAALCFFFFALNLGHRIADRRAELVQSRIDNAFLRFQLDNEKNTSADKARLAEAAESRVSDIQEKVATYESELAAQKPLPEICDDHVGVDEHRRLLDISNRSRGTKRQPLSIIDRLRGPGKER